MEHVHCPFFEQAQKNPHRPALMTQQRVWTYGELDAEINSLCHFLENVGIKENQRIAFPAQTNVATILLFFALFRLRAIACPLNYRLPQELLADYILHLKAAHVLEPSLLPPDMCKPQANQSVLDLHHPATFLFTSGSGGVPKIACHSFANHYYNALGAFPSLRLDIDSRWLLSLPLFHVSGLGILFRCFLRGATVVLSDLPLSEAISEFQISHLSLIPTQLYRLLKEPAPRIERMKASLACILIGGSPIPSCLLQEANQLGLPIHTTYGMTEMSSLITLSEMHAEGHAGTLLPFRQLKSNDNELWVRGETLFLGYWNPQTETILSPQNDEGWFPTKDLGRLNSEGRLEVLGRKDRQFISSGENIQPEEIEQVLCTIPGIRQATVIPIPDPEFGERPAAFIDDETGLHTIETLREHLRSRLPSLKHPVRIFPYPKEAGMKPSFKMLKEYLENN
jgi:O-succinylbenzoic acid--CoA ligase